jgi:hypothetical protein
MLINFRPWKSAMNEALSSIGFALSGRPVIGQSRRRRWS